MIKNLKVFVFVVLFGLLTPTVSVLASSIVENTNSDVYSSAVNTPRRYAQKLGTGLSGTIRSVTIMAYNTASVAKNWVPEAGFAGYTNSSYSTGFSQYCSLPGNSGYPISVPPHSYATFTITDYGNNSTGCGSANAVLDSSKYYVFQVWMEANGTDNEIRPVGSVTSYSGGSLCYVNAGNPSLNCLGSVTDLASLFFVADTTDSPALPPIPVSGNVTTSTTWEGGRVYTLSGDVTVNSGVTLTVNSGAYIKLTTATSSLIVNGTLTTQGISGNPVVFTSIKDDSVGLDTNGDGTATTPAAGDWRDIQIGSGGSVTLNNTIVRYGGYTTSSSAAQLYNNGGSLSLSGAVVSDGTTYGIRNDGGTTTISASDIGFSTYGLYLSGGSASITATSTIHDNSSYGVYNNTTNTINAEGNYWGDPSGPYHSSNLSGTGNAVSDYVDFTPWISSLHYVITPANDSVTGCLLRYTASTTYSTQLSSAVSTWNARSRVSISSATSTTDLSISDVANRPDLVWKGQWQGGAPGTIQLNTYYLQYSDSSRVQNTIVHELGHALGLDHSYTGNVMYFAQTPQTSLGTQDISDYDYLWQALCP